MPPCCGCVPDGSMVRPAAVLGGFDIGGRLPGPDADEGCAVAVEDACVGRVRPGAAEEDVRLGEEVTWEDCGKAADAAAAAVAAPGTSEERAAFMRFPTLDPLRRDTEVRFSPVDPSASILETLRASAVASRTISRKSANSCSSETSFDSG